MTQLFAGLSRRLKFWRTSFYLEGVVVMTTLSVYGTFALLRDEVFPSWAAFVFIPLWPWWVWTILILIVFILCIAEGNYREYKKLEDRLKQHESTVERESEIEIEYREGDTRWRTLQGDRESVQISLVNKSGRTIDNIEILCVDAIPTRPGDFTLTAAGRNTQPPIRLSPGEPFYPRIAVLAALAASSHGDEFHLTIPHATPHSLNLRGEEFLVKIIVIDRDVRNPARKMLRMGRRNGQFYVSAEG